MKLSFFCFVAATLNCGTTNAFQNNYLSSLTAKTGISAVSEKSTGKKNKEFPANDYFESLLKEENGDDASSSSLSPTAKYMAAIEKKGESLDIDKFLGEMEAYLDSVNDKNGSGKSSSLSYSSISKMEEYLSTINDDQSAFFDAISDLSVDIPTAADDVLAAAAETTITSSATVDHRIIGSKMMPAATVTTDAYPSSKIMTPSSAVVTPSGYITTAPTSVEKDTDDDDDNVFAILHNKIISKKELREKEKYVLTQVDLTFLSLCVAFLFSIPFFNDLLL